MVKAKPEPVTQVPGSSNEEESRTVPTSENKPDAKPKPKPKAVAVIKPKPKQQAIPPVVENEPEINYGSISGQVILLDDKGQALPAKGTLITLTPKQPREASSAQPAKLHVIDMEDKEYQPRFSSINAGDQVVFVNKDNIRHNVFSSSGGNAFDLGTYGAGLKRAVILQEPGIVKIYCNIHADMATFIAVGDPGLSAKADEQGRYQLNKLPLGRYQVRIWNIRGETTRDVEVTASQTVNLIDRIDTSAFTVESHKNKFGGNYSKNAALFEDEFY